MPVGVAAVAAALAAVFLRGRDRATVRVAGLLVVIAAVFAAMDWPRPEVRVEPGELRVATNGDDEPVWRTRLLDAARQQGATVTVDTGELDIATLTAAARAGVGAQVASVWDGSIDVAKALRLHGIADSAHATRPAWPFDADDVQVALAAPARAGRPARLEVRLEERARAALGVDARIAISVLDDARELAQIERSVGDEPVIALEFRPDSSGRLEVAIEFRPDATLVMRLRGEFAVGTDAEVLVVGPLTATIANALRAQGRRVRSESRLPEVLDAGVVVLTARCDEGDAVRLATFVDDGGGLFLIGGPGGGALPLAIDPLAAIAPLLRLPPLPPILPPHGDPSPRAGEAAPLPDAGEAPAPAAGAEGPLAGTTESVAEQRDVVVERKSIALVLVVDLSGSMTEAIAGVLGPSKIDLARESALATAKNLEPGDEFGVVGFDGQVHRILPLATAPGPAAVESAIRRLAATGGMTLLGPAMLEAERWMRTSTAPIRHIVVITDGELADPADAALAQSVSLRLRTDPDPKRWVIVNAIMVVPDQKFVRMANLSGVVTPERGVLIKEAEGDSITRFVADVTTTALRAAGRAPKSPAARQPRPDPAIDPPPRPPEPQPPEPERPEPQPSKPPEPEPPQPEGPRPEPLRVVAIEDSPLLAPEPAAGYPALFGIAPVEAVARAAVLLATTEGTPLFAWNHHGLGRVAAWSADLDGAWSAAWREDPLFGARLSTWVESLAPSSDRALLAVARRAVEMEPKGPARAETAWLAAAARGAVDDVATLGVPPSRVITGSRGQAADLALALVAILIGLAVLEAIARRRP